MEADCGAQRNGQLPSLRAVLRMELEADHRDVPIGPVDVALLGASLLFIFLTGTNPSDPQVSHKWAAAGARAA